MKARPLSIAVAFLLTTIVAPPASAITTVSDSIRLGLGASGNPASAYGAGKHLFVWTASATDGSDIYGRLMASWAGLEGGATGIGIATSSGAQGAPAIAWDGTNFMVVWQDQRGADTDIYGQRVAPDGTLVGTEISISTETRAQASPLIAWNGTTGEYLVTWTDFRNCHGACDVYPDIYAQRIGSDGILTGSNFAMVSPAPSWKTISAIEWDRVGGGYVAAVGSLIDGYRKGSVLPLGADGSASGSPIQLATGAWDQDGPTLTWTGSGFMAAWADYRHGSEDSDIWGARIGVAPVTASAPFVMVSASGNQLSPAMEWTGLAVTLAWEDLRNGGNPDLFAQQFDANGAPVPFEIAMATGPSHQQAATVAFSNWGSKIAYRDNAELLLKHVNGPSGPNAPPTITFASSPDGSDGRFATAPATVTVTATDTDDGMDNGTGMAGLTCELDGSPIALANGGSTPTTMYGDVTTSTVGDHIVACEASDSLGATATYGDNQTHLKLGSLDTTPPTVTITLSPAAPTDGQNGFFDLLDISDAGDSIEVKVSATDSLSAVVDLACAEGTAPVAVMSQEGSAPRTGSFVVSANGIHDYICTATDAAGNSGNTGSSNTATVKIDSGVPTLLPTISPSPAILGSSVTASPNPSDPVVDGYASGIASSSCASVDTSSTGVHSVECSAMDNAGNSASVALEYTVQYMIQGFFSPASNSRWKAKQTVPVKIALASSAAARISDSTGTSLASACRVKLSASGSQALSEQCMKYDAANNQFTFNWRLGSGTGPETITVTVFYPATSVTTSKSEGITITK